MKKANILLILTLCLFSSSFLLITSKKTITFKTKTRGEYSSAISQNDDLYDYSWHLRKIQADLAWSISYGNSDVSVGFVDTGIDNTISDLDCNLDYLNSLDCVGNHSRSPFLDSCIHGTHVASIFGSRNSDIDFYTGVAPFSNIISYKTDQNYMVPDYSATVYAMNNASYLSTQPIINFNVSFPCDSTTDYYDLYNSFSNFNGLIVVAAGNDGCNLDYCLNQLQCYLAPQIFTHNNIIVVGASTEEDFAVLNTDTNNVWASNYGENTVDLFAPGLCVHSLPLTNNSPAEPSLFDGTCAATPQVAGTAALIKSVNPTLTTSQIKSLILNNVDVVTSLTGLCATGGRLNCYKAVKAAIPSYTPSFGTTMPSIQPLNPNQHQFYKVNLTPGTYLFETTGSLDLYGSLFADIQNNPVAIDTDFFGNCSFTYTTNISRTVYFKVQNLSLSSGSYGIKISESLGHIHAYNDSYLWVNANQHRAYCSCLSSVLQPHTVTPNNPHYCVLCGGYADLGVIGPLSLYEEIGNDSRLTPNGVVILGDIDYELISSGELTVEQLLLGGTTL